MVNPNTEQLVPFGKAPEIIPGRPALSQVYRWAMRGLRGVKLEWIQVGGRRFTSREALQRFFDRLTAAAGGESTPIVTPRARRRQLEQAERELKRAGFEIGREE